MRQFKFLVAAAFISLFYWPLAAAAQAAPAASPSDQTYEISLQVLVGSGNAVTGADVPQNLTGVVRELRTRFPFENYRLMNTYFARLGSSGTFEYKSVTNMTGEPSDVDSPSFLEWTIGQLRATDGGGQRDLLQAQPFRFGARVPVRLSTVKDEAGKPIGNIAYESIGLNMNRLIFHQNTPTLIGSLALPKTSGTLFLVLTARSLEQ